MLLKRLRLPRSESARLRQLAATFSRNGMAASVPTDTRADMEIYALILAGGSGERFWPLIRHALPKQLLLLVSTCSLLEETVRRLDGLIPPARILFLSNADQENGVRELLKNISSSN